MKAWLLFLIFSCNLTAHAAGWEGQIFLLSPETRWDRSSDQNIEPRNVTSYAAALRKDSFSALLESGSFKEDSGNSTLGVSREVETILLWGRLHFAGQDRGLWEWSTYAGLGLGTNHETVKTKFNGSEVEDRGPQNLAGGVGIGADLALRFFRSLALVAAAEGRLIGSQDLDPNPQVSAVLRLGLQF